MIFRYLLSDLERALGVRQQIQNRKCDGGGFLHAGKAPERPFPVILLDCDTPFDITIRYFVHTRVFAVIGACPTCDPEIQGESYRC